MTEIDENEEVHDYQQNVPQWDDYQQKHLQWNNLQQHRRYTMTVTATSADHNSIHHATRY